MSANIRSFLAPVLAEFLLFSSSTFAADSLEEGIGDLARQIVDKSKSESKQSIAVAPFQHGDGSLSVLSNYMVDELVLGLFSIPDAELRIVERSQLERMLQELKLSQSGLVDVETAKQLGKVHGVDALIVGSITPIGERVRVIARMISTESGRVFSAAATTVPHTETIRSLSSQTISRPQSNSRTLQGGSRAVSPNPKHVKDVGSLQITLKKVLVVPDTEVRVLLSYTNRSDDTVTIDGYGLGNKPNLYDSYGNSFRLTKNSFHNGLKINPGETAAVSAYFEYRSDHVKVAETFGVTVPFRLNQKHKQSVSFTQISAQTLK